MSYLNLANTSLELVVLGEAVAGPLTLDEATGGFVRAQGDRAVMAQVTNLLEYRTGERLHREDRGLDAQQSIFDNLETSRDVLPLKIHEALTLFEKRIRQVRTEAHGEGKAVYIDVSWVLKASGAASGTVYRPNGE